MEFIKAKKEHLEEFLTMMEDFYQMNEYSFSEHRAADSFLEIIANDALGKVWLIGHNHHIIGYLIFTYGFSFEYGGRDAFVDEIYLKADFRNQGFGTMILETLDFLAKKENVKAIHLEVERLNSSGNKLYLKSGYSGNDRTLLTKIID